MRLGRTAAWSCMTVFLALWTLLVLWISGADKNSSAAYQATIVEQAFPATKEEEENKGSLISFEGNRHGKGFLYFIVGPVEKLYQDACFSVRTFSKHTRHRNFTLVTDEFGVSLFRSRKWCEGAFNQVINIHETIFRDAKRRIKPLKVRSYQLSPYRDTVFLDADTMACRNVDDLFVVLEYVDLAAAYATGRHHGGGGPAKEAFPEINTGVVAYRDTEATRRLLQTWDHRISRSAGKATLDQPSFRVALLEDRNVRFHVLPPEFMCRSTPNGCGTTVMMQGLDPIYNFEAVPCRIIHSKRIQREDEPFPPDLHG
ncbi:Nucleotide-diphospho-sugar transferase [Balamuthia mandrillaris]